jgi:hypothetical protein
MDYPKIIKHPMDLGTIQNRLKKGAHYKTLYQVAEDVRLVWTNCMTYNADGSDFYKLAESLNKKWDDKYTKLLKDCNHNVKPAPASKSSDEKVSLQEKKNFAKSLYTISKEDLGRILVEVEQKCPEAIVRNSTEDEVEFNIDKLSSQLISDLTGFVNNAKGKKKAPSGKAKVEKA